MIPSTEPLAGTDIGSAAYSDIHDRLLMATIFLYSLEGGQPTFCGTATCMAIAGARFIVTASHVLDAVGGPDFAVATKAGVSLTTVSKTYMSVTTLKGSEYGEWGPDIAICKVPEPIATLLLPDGKVWHPLDRPPLSTDAGIHWFWVLVGVPDEMSTHGTSEDVLATRAIGCHTLAFHERDGYRYVDLFFDRERYNGLPVSFGGISGGGLWVAEFQAGNETFTWTGRVAFRGVAYFQHRDTDTIARVRCHDRGDVMNAIGFADECRTQSTGQHHDVRADSAIGEGSNTDRFGS